jgi:hypothetical protein
MKITKKEIRSHFNSYWSNDQIAWSGISKEIIRLFVEKRDEIGYDGIAYNKKKMGKILVDYVYEKLNK